MFLKKNTWTDNNLRIYIFLDFIFKKNWKSGVFSIQRRESASRNLDEVAALLTLLLTPSLNLRHRYRYKWHRRAMPSGQANRANGIVLMCERHPNSCKDKGASWQWIARLVQDVIKLFIQTRIYCINTKRNQPDRLDEQETDYKF